MNCRFTFFNALVIFFLSATSLLANGDENAPEGYKYLKLDDITISCDLYNSEYKHLVQKAVHAGNSHKDPYTFKELDHAFGGYIKAWVNSWGEAVDKDGHPINREKTIEDKTCVENSKWVKYYEWGHDGEKIWKHKLVTDVSYKNVWRKFKQGVINVEDCTVKCVQDVWPSITSCGTGKIVRQWKISWWCDWTDHTITLKQTIHVVPGCELSKNMVNVPQDTSICWPLKYGADKKIALPSSVKKPTLKFQPKCGNIGSSFSDFLYKVAGQEGVYKVVRTYEFKDWCSGKKVHCPVKILIDTNCWDGKDDEDDGGHDSGGSDNFKALQSLADLEISCDAYQSIYADDVNKALEAKNSTANEAIFKKMNLLFGTYSKAVHKGAFFENNHGDRYPTRFRVYSTKCDSTNTAKGYEYAAKHGFYTGECARGMTQDITADMDSCGLGTITRTFTLSMPECADSALHSLTFKQEINIVSSCNTFETSNIKIPADTTICVKLQQDDDGHFLEPEGLKQPTYDASEGCGGLSVDYDFVLVYDSKDKYKYDLTREWTFRSSCGRDSIVKSQRVTIVDTCDTSGAPYTKGISKLENMDRGDLDKPTNRNKKAVTAIREEMDALGQNKPNPFDGSTEIPFYVSKARNITLVVFNQQGRVVKEISGDFLPGWHVEKISRRDLNSAGIYTYQLRTDDTVLTKRMVLN